MFLDGSWPDHNLQVSVFEVWGMNQEYTVLLYIEVLLSIYIFLVFFFFLCIIIKYIIKL